MTKRLSLEEVASEYPILLLDTCALYRSLDGGGGFSESDERTIEERISISHEICNSAILFREFIENRNNFYVTPRVLREYPRHPHKAKNRRTTKYNSKKLNRIKRYESREVIKLIKTLEDNGRILQLDESENRIYQSLDEKYFNPLYKRGLSRTDIGFLFSGAVVSETRKSTCLLSNDFGILRAWGDILRLEGINSEQLGFFLRRDFDVFERNYL